MIHALTLRADGIRNILVSDIGVSLPFLGGVKGTIAPFKGIWDTGASGSTVTANVVKALQLKPTGKKKVNHAQGSSIVDTYLVNIHLPSNITIENVTVVEGKLMTGVDLLIGMDIITLGDFSVTNKDRKTVMSFRVPSLVCHDYVPDANNRNQIEAKTNARTHNVPKKKRRKIKYHK